MNTLTKTIGTLRRHKDVPVTYKLRAILAVFMVLGAEKLLGVRLVPEDYLRQVENTAEGQTFTRRNHHHEVV